MRHLSVWVLALIMLVPAQAMGQATAGATDAEIDRLIAQMGKDNYAGKEAADALVQIGKPAAPKLVAAMSNPKAMVRYWSAAAAARIGAEEAYQPLCKLGKDDPDATVRATAVYYLRLYQRDETWKFISAALSDRDELVRGYAIRALQENNRTEAVPALRELAVKHEDFKTRYDAMAACASLMKSGQVEFLRERLREDAQPEVRQGALRCLTVIPGKPATILSVMIDGLEDKDLEVRGSAGELLGKGTNQAFGFTADAAPEKRTAAAAAWRKWYETNKDRLYWDTGKRRFEIKPTK